MESVDENTAVLRGVATNARFFNKPATNMLVKRARISMPFLLCVDEDLQYLGRNPGVVQVFSGGACLRAWRILGACGDVGAERLDDLIISGCAVLGSDGREPALTWPLVSSAPAAPMSNLARWGQELFLSEYVARAIGRDEEVEQVMAALLTGEPLMPVVFGESGVGKTTVVRAALGRAVDSIEGRAFSLDLGVLLAGTLVDAEREGRMAATLAECRQSCVRVLVAENLQLGLVGSAHVPFLLAAALDDGIRIVGTMGSRDRPHLARPPLARRTVSVTLIEPRPDETAAILRARLTERKDEGRLAVPGEFVEFVVESAAPLAGSYPAKAVALLDAALSRARLMGATALSPDHVQIAAGGFAEEAPARSTAR